MRIKRELTGLAAWCAISLAVVGCGGKTDSREGRPPDPLSTRADTVVVEGLLTGEVIECAAVRNAVGDVFALEDLPPPFDEWRRFVDERFMVVGEEVEALRVHAISPVRFLVLPRLLATVVAMVCLCVIADLAGCLGGYVSSLLAIGPEAYQGYWDRIAAQLGVLDFTTGLIKAGVFGLILALLACHEGLKVRGGAEGVGRATTMTVVYTIFSLVAVDCIFTVIFYVYKL